MESPERIKRRIASSTTWRAHFCSILRRSTASIPAGTSDNLGRPTARRDCAQHTFPSPSHGKVLAPAPNQSPHNTIPKLAPHFRVATKRACHRLNAWTRCKEAPTKYGFASTRTSTLYGSLTSILNPPLYPTFVASPLLSMPPYLIIL